MTVPLTRLSARDLARFEWSTSVPAAVRILRRQLGSWRTTRVLVELAVRKRKDPLAHIPRAPDWPSEQETLCRQQLRTLFHLDDITRDRLGLDEAARDALLRDLIVELGAVFVAKMMPVPRRRVWQSMREPEREALLRSLGERMFNARLGAMRIDHDRLTLEITACRYVELCRAAGREHLAQYFCVADSHYFDSAESFVELRRTGTIARGAARCDFEFRYRS